MTVRENGPRRRRRGLSLAIGLAALIAAPAWSQEERPRETPEAREREAARRERAAAQEARRQADQNRAGTEDLRRELEARTRERDALQRRVVELETRLEAVERRSDEERRPVEGRSRREQELGRGVGGDREPQYEDMRRRIEEAVRAGESLRAAITGERARRSGGPDEPGRMAPPGAPAPGRAGPIAIERRLNRLEQAVGRLTEEVRRLRGERPPGQADDDGAEDRPRDVDAPGDAEDDDGESDRDRRPDRPRDITPDRPREP